MKLHGWRAFALVVAGSVLVSACSTGVFRNRNFDYLKQPVEQLPSMPKTPKGLQDPGFDTYYPIPDGQNSYAPASSVNMLPPEVKHPVNKAAQLQTPSAVSEVAHLQQQVAELQKKAPAKVSKKPMRVMKKEAIQAEAAPVLWPPMSATLATLDNGAGQLTIDGKINQILPRTQTMLFDTGYRLVDIAQEKGFIFIAPANEEVAGNTSLLTLTENEDGTLMVVYTPTGEVDHSAKAYDLLKKIQANLAK